MVKTLVYFIFFGLLFSSCQYVENLTHRSNERIDFKTVDTYPLFPTCDSLATPEFQKKCFEETATNLIKAELEVNQLSSPVPITNAIIVRFKIDSKGKASLVELENFDNIKEYLPELEDLIASSFDNFPIIKPAVKRGIPVSSTYMVPIYLVD